MRELKTFSQRVLIYICTVQYKHDAKEDSLALAVRTAARNLEWQSRQQLRENDVPMHWDSQKSKQNS